VSGRWEPDGVGCGGHYLDTSREGVRAGVHDYGVFVECHVWTPGCGFEPRKTIHASLAEAKAHAESELRAMAPEDFREVTA
jgi:hypothetical protein